jgi:hypothetical protein
MEATMDWNAVKELAEFYIAAGLGDTRSGHFLSNVAVSQQVHGGATSWLQSLLEMGDPAPWVALASELRPHLDNAGGEDRYLSGIVSRLAEGKRPKDWEVEVVARVKARATAQPAPLVDYQVNILNAVDGIIHNGNHFYWSRRSGFHDKAMRVVSMAKNTNSIHPDDWKWITEGFKGVVRGVETTAGEDGQIRFWSSPSGWKTVLVMGNGYYHRDKRGIVQDCMCEGQIVPIRTDKLRKRKPKESQ